MKSPIRMLAVLMLLWLTGGPRPPSLQPLYAERIAIVATPVTLVRDDAARTRVGAMTLLGGWKLTSASRQFGGLSALAVHGRELTAIGDAGSMLRFRLGNFGRPYAASIAALPPGCGRSDDKIWRDTESLAHDPTSGDWWVGYEWRNAVCRVSRDFATRRGLAAPPALRGWSKTAGPEAMMRLPDGRFVIVAENDPRRGSTRPIVVFDRDPTDPAARFARFAWQPPAGYNPTEIAALPDGRWLMLVRRIALDTLFTTQLLLIDPRARVGRRLPNGRVLARLEPPVIHDNFEGLSVTVESGRPIVWMISDNNFLDWQSTYLLKLAIDPAALAIRRPRPAPLRSSASNAEPSG